jgi:CRP/FNR family transcriptional regulator, cyclic AMP receptor protein
MAPGFLQDTRPAAMEGLPLVEWPLLAQLPEEDRRRFLANGRRQRFAKGDVIFHAGDPAESLHLVAKGRLAVWSFSELGDAAMLRVIGPGGFVGEMALLEEGGLRSATVRALEPAETLSVGRGDFDRLRLEHPSVDRVLLTALSSELRRVSDLLTEMLFVPAETRVLRRLLSVAALWENGAPLSITQQELAGLAGTTRATANRALRQAAGDGLIGLRRGSIELLDKEGLSRRARTRGMGD